MARNKVVFAGETLIDLTDTTVTPEKLILGATALDKTGAAITGTNPYEKTTTDNQITTQTDLITQIKAALDGKAAGGSGGAKIASGTITLGTGMNYIVNVALTHDLGETPNFINMYSEDLSSKYGLFGVIVDSNQSLGVTISNSSVQLGGMEILESNTAPSSGNVIGLYNASQTICVVRSSGSLARGATYHWILGVI